MPADKYFAYGAKFMKKYPPRITNVGIIARIERIGIVVGEDYDLTLIGLGAIPPEDAIYPVANADKDGNKIVGEHNYVIHFDHDKLPPVRAFWSFTMYDEEGFQVANGLNRFAIGDRDDLTFNKDGSLDIYIQHASPGKAKESNWLPSPEKGVLGITLRLYQPKGEVLDGRWIPPYIERVK